MKTKYTLDIAKRVFTNEITALEAVRDSLDDSFIKILNEVMDCTGKIIVTGMGKSGHIARKIAASMSSLGSCAIFIHPGECVHGDLGMIQAKDIAILISYSGESEEIIKIIPGINIIGAKIIGITGNTDSSLAKNAHITQIFPKFSEASSLAAPTSSTTAALVYGDALAVAASELKGFSNNEYSLLHPSGSLGKRLNVRVVDCMQRNTCKTILTDKSTIAETIKIFCETKWEILPVYDERGNLSGTISDEIIQDLLCGSNDIYSLCIKENVNRNPMFVNCEDMAVNALKVMEKNSINVMLAVNEEKVIGIIRRDDVLNQGIFI
jgi:arabinose-5-phosphate isomerase